MSFVAVIWADNGFKVISHFNSEIDHKADHLIVAREGLQKPIIYKGKAGQFPSTVKLKGEDFICCVEDSTYAQYENSDSILYVKDGMYFFRLPTHYKAPVTKPTGPLLSVVSNMAGNFASIASATGFLCIQYNDSLSKRFDKITLRSDSIPIAGDMIFDGLQLIPLPDQPTEVTVNFKNSRKFVIPVPADVDLKFDIIASDTKTGSSKKFHVEDNISRGDIRCHYIWGVKKSDDPEPEDSISEPIKKKFNCPSYIPITPRELLTRLYDDLQKNYEIKPGHLRNWGSNMPLNQWGYVNYKKGGYNVSLKMDDMRSRAAALVLAYLMNVGLNRGSEDVEMKLTDNSRPYCEFEPTIKSVMKIENCDSIKELKLESFRSEGLVVRNCENLTTLNAVDCSFEKLEISCCPNLTKVVVPLNRIKDLDIKNCPELSVLIVCGNFLKELKLEDFPELSILNCSVNDIETLNLENNPKLIALFCGYNKLSKLNLDAQTELQQLSSLGNVTLNIVPAISQLENRGLEKYNVDGKIVDLKKNRGTTKK